MQASSMSQQSQQAHFLWRFGHEIISTAILSQRLIQDEQLSVTCICQRVYILHRNSTVARRVTNVTSEHYGNP